MIERVIKGNKVSTCPNCGSTNLDWGDCEVDGDYYVYYFECKDCGVYGEEYHELTYSHSVSFPDR